MGYMGYHVFEEMRLRKKKILQNKLNHFFHYILLIIQSAREIQDYHYYSML